ncbi:DUF742 domain-containing protein [Actinorugispora endophytica]|nr:DUF742 domain-containing protein [Actinorugispora endophytica]
MVQAHTLVRVADASVAPSDPVVVALPDGAGAVYGVCLEAQQPLLLVEVAARLQIPRGAALVLVTGLVEQGLLRAGTGVPTRIMLEGVLDALAGL